MAEKIDIVVSTTVQLGNSTKSIEELKRMLEDARIAHQKMVAQFGEGSKEAQETANAIKEIENALNSAEQAGKELDKPVKSMKQQLKEANADLQLAVDKFGIGSKEAAEAAKRVAELKDTIGDAKTLTDAFNPDAKFKGLANAVQGAVGAITALQGAQALFGSESEDLQKTLVKVQGALALSQGVNSVLEAKDSFKALGSQAADALKEIRTGIGATGIGLLVVALGTLVAYWDDIKGAVSGVSSEQEKLNKQTEKDLAANQEKLSALDGQEQQLKAQGLSEKEILELKTKQTDEAIKSAEINLQNAKITKEEQVKAAERNKTILQGLINFVSLPITALLAGVDMLTEKLNSVGVISDETFKKVGNLRNRFTESIAKLVFDPAEVAKEGDEAIKKAEGTLNSLKEKRAGYQNSIKQIDKQASEKRTAEQQKRDEEELKLAEKRKQENIAIEKQIQENRLAQIADGFYKERLLIDSAYDEKIQQLFDKEKEQKDALDKSLKDGLITRKEYNNQIAIIQSQSAEQRKAIDEKYNLDVATLERKELERRTAAQKETDNLLFETRMSGLKEGLTKSLEVLEKGTQDEIDSEIEKLNKKQITQEEYDQRRLGIEEKYQNSRKKIIEDNSKKELDQQISRLEQQVSNEDLSVEKRLEAIDKEKEALDAYYKGKTDQEDEYNAKVKELSDARIAIQLAELAKKQELEKEIFATIQSGVDLYSTLIENQLQKVEGRQKKEEKVQKDLLNSKKITQQQYEENIKKINEKADKDRIKLQKRQIIAEKAMGVANIILNTLQANAKSVAQFPATFGQPWVTLNTIQGALGVATTIAQAAKALAALGAGGDSGGGGGSIPSGSGGSAPIAPQQQTTTIDPNQVNQIASANATVRAYVVESDVSGNQERISRLNRAARIS